MGIEGTGPAGGVGGIAGTGAPAPGTSPSTIFKPDFKPKFAMDSVAQDRANQGFAALKAGDPKLAKAYFERSNEVQPNPLASNRLSVALTRLESWVPNQGFVEAEAAIAKALELEPGYPPALYNLAVEHARKGEYDEALEIFERGVFPNGQAFIDGAKGDTHLDGLRETKLSKDGYAFPLKEASAAQKLRFAQLIGEAPSSSTSRDADGQLPNVPLAPTAPAVPPPGVRASNPVPEWFDTTTAQLTSQLAPDSGGHLTATVRDAKQNRLVVRVLPQNHVEARFAQAGQDLVGAANAITPDLARELLAMLPLAIARSPIGVALDSSTKLDVLLGALQAAAKRPEVIRYE